MASNLISMWRSITGMAILLLFSLSLQAQIYDPVTWVMQTSPLEGDLFEIKFTAKIEKGWSIYSQYLEGDDGPIPTSFEFDAGNHFEKVGATIESGNRKEAFDPIFQMNLVKFTKEAIFTQKVKIKDYNKPVTGYLTYMTCDDTKCLPPQDIDFDFSFTKSGFPSSGDAGANEKSTGDVAKAESKMEDVTAATEKKSNSADKEEMEELTSSAEIATDEISNNAGENTIFDPVNWSAEVKDLGEGTYELLVKAIIDEGWNIYSQTLEGEDGPVPTAFFFDESDSHTLEGETAESAKKRVEEFDKNFDMNLVKLKEEVLFTQRVKTTDPNMPFTGGLEFMVCNDSRCLPPAFVPFKASFSEKTVQIGEEAEADNGAAIQGDPADPTAVFTVLNGVDFNEPVGECTVQEEEKKGLWGIFFLGFLGGFIALLTPCVFPMIPLTVSFFTKGSQNKRQGLVNAFLYGFFIFAVYALLSVPFHLMDQVDPNILNDISTNIWLNISFFAIFLFFAFSFFGYYELTLPSSWTNRVSSAESIGGILGVFFMALTLALVSFSCTGPILGSLLAGALSSDGGAMQLTAGMSGFGLALALPFALFAAFPGWLNSLPKSGGWLNTVKVVLGFVELALAFKFLSNADLVKEWGILKVEPFLALWILVAIGLALYLFGLIKFPHDSPGRKINWVKAGLGVASVAFAIYMATGLIYDKDAGSLKPLTLLSGLAPPSCYSFFYPCDCPQNLNCFKDFEEGFAYAQAENKPIMIDFTGHACVNCRKMEEHVWPRKEVYDIIDKNYVLISLYVDEKHDLPEDQQISVPLRTRDGSKRLRTTGSVWQYLQTEYFGNNSQPWYVLLSPDGKLLTKGKGYTPDVTEYANFLKCGLDAYEELENGGLLGQKK